MINEYIILYDSDNDDSISVVNYSKALMNNTVFNEMANENYKRDTTLLKLYNTEWINVSKRNKRKLVDKLLNERPIVMSHESFDDINSELINSGLEVNIYGNENNEMIAKLNNLIHFTDNRQIYDYFKNKYIKSFGEIDVYAYNKFSGNLDETNYRIFKKKINKYDYLFKNYGQYLLTEEEIINKIRTKIEQDVKDTAADIEYYEKMYLKKSKRLEQLKNQLDEINKNGIEIVEQPE